MSNHLRSRLSSLSLQWRVGALALAALLVLFGLFGLLGSQLADDNARAMAAERLGVARLTAQLLDRQFDEQFRELEWIADGLSASEPGAPAPADLLRPSEMLLTSLTLVDATGHVVWSLPGDNDQPGADLSGELYVRTPLASNQRYASGVAPRGCRWACSWPASTRPTRSPACCCRPRKSSAPAAMPSWSTRTCG
jgi:hypothetical protein